MKQQDRAHRKGWKRAKQAAAWLALLPVAALVLLSSRLTDPVHMQPAAELRLPRFSLVKPLGAPCRPVGSLALDGIPPNEQDPGYRSSRGIFI